AVPAIVEEILSFELGEAVDIFHVDGRHQVSSVAALCGTQSRFAAHMALRPGTRSFGIFFQPAGFWYLFGVPMFEVTNRAEEAEAVLGPAIRTLCNRFGGVPPFEDCIQRAAEF